MSISPVRAAPVAGDRPQSRLDQVPDGAPFAVRADGLVPLRHAGHGGPGAVGPAALAGLPVDNRRGCGRPDDHVGDCARTRPDDHRTCTRDDRIRVVLTWDGVVSRPDGAGGAGRIPCRSWTDDGAFPRISRSRVGTRRPTGTPSRTGAARATRATATTTSGPRNSAPARTTAGTPTR